MNTRLSVPFDLATHRGYEFDYSRVTGDVAKLGVVIYSFEDMKILFERTPLDRVPVRPSAADDGDVHHGRKETGTGRN